MIPTTPPAFLSTLSLRRATSTVSAARAGTARFYPRSPCGERLASNAAAIGKNTVSIHALLAESDLSNRDMRTHNHQFLSTLSLRRATTGKQEDSRKQQSFYPRSPCGERRAPRITPAASRSFYPRSPCGERLFSFLMYP